MIEYVFQDKNWVLRWTKGEEQQGIISFLGVNDDPLYKATLYYTNLLGVEHEVCSCPTQTPLDSEYDLLVTLSKDLFKDLPEDKINFVPITMIEWSSIT